MKQRIGMVILAIGACLLAGCSMLLSGDKSGEVVAYGGEPLMFELACEDGEHYGFVINEETELVWQDESAFSIWEDTNIEVDDWDVFGCSMYVTVEAGDETYSADDYVDECVRGWYFAEKITVTGVNEDYFAVDYKPVIYLYPEKETKVSVNLDYKGKLTCTYPKYNNGWKVTAKPDGTLTDANGQIYNYLYWEGISFAEYDFSEGFCVSGEETAAFLEDALMKLGLNRQEANEFIVYWLPLMEGNAYNLISFQTEIYTENAQLSVLPKPDTMIRVFMAWKPLEEREEIQPQSLSAPERNGFTVVEWGGTKINE